MSNMEVFALIISIAAFALSLIQFCRESSRQKKEATLIAYNELQDDVLSKLNKYPVPMTEIEYHGEEWHEITVCLAKLERFSVGINTGIYSLETLDRLGGAYFIRQFEKLMPIIGRKRAEHIADGKHYDEFEKTVNKLRKKRREVNK